MKSPFTGEDMSVVKEWRIMNFRKEEFKVLFHSYKCIDTKEQFEDEVFAQLNYNQIVNQYREKFSIPFTEQIIAIRKKYDVPASKMSEILGLGANSYRNYENGEVPSQAIGRLIQLVNDPQEFEKLVDLCKTLETKYKEKLLKRIHLLIDKQSDSKFEKFLENYFFKATLPNKYTGYKLPSLVKFTEMVVFFAQKLQPWKTKLNKLLFYADFANYQQTGFSISGMQYKAIPMGPVPNNFNSIFEYISNKADVDIHFTNFEDGGTGEQFKPNDDRPFNNQYFTQDELQILENIAMRFKNTSTNEIIDISHKEKAWIENSNKQMFIDYRYSFDLN